MAGERPWHRLSNEIWGYDFFISYQWSSGGRYAVSLAERLRDLKYDCFLDRAEFAAGDDWRAEATKALRHTRRLIVIATRDAMKHSKPVETEIHHFGARGDRIIPIVFGTRFSDAEHAEIPALALIRDTAVDIIESAERENAAPSDEAVAKLHQTHAVLRRRQLRARIVAGAIAVLSIALVAVAVFAFFADWARHNEEAGRLITTANLERETKGPLLDHSVELAVTAHETARSDAAKVEAKQAIAAGLALTPDRLGAPWTPFGGDGSHDASRTYHLRALEDRVLVLDDREGAEPFAELETFDVAARSWRAAQVLDAKTYGVPLREEGGAPIIASRDPRWLVTIKDQHTLIWDLAAGAHNELSGTFLALSESGKFALAQDGDALILAALGANKQDKLSFAYDASARYALSADGAWIAWAKQNEFSLVRVAKPEKVYRAPITRSGGHVLELGFLSGDGFEEGGSVYVRYSQNQIAQMAPSASSRAPSMRADLWRLSLEDLDVDRPDLRIVRALDFSLVFDSTGSTRVVVLDETDPLQFLNAENQVSFTLGPNAGRAVNGQFAGVQFLAVHADGTARLWDSMGRNERVRYSAPDLIKDAVLIRGASAPFVVTQDGKGRLQAWSIEPTAKTSHDRLR